MIVVIALVVQMVGEVLNVVVCCCKWGVRVLFHTFFVVIVLVWLVFIVGVIILVFWFYGEISCNGFFLWSKTLTLFNFIRVFY